MRTDALIAKLADQADPVSRFALTPRLVLALGTGVLCAIALQLATVGLRPDATLAWFAMSWKIAFCMIVALAWVTVVRRGSIPGLSVRPFVTAAVITLAITGVVAMFSGFDIEAAYGCITRVLVLAAPAAFVLFWLARRSAPTQPVLTGFAIGTAAGAIGALAYAFGCLTDVPQVVAFRYGLSIIATGAIGAAIGYLVLRW